MLLNHLEIHDMSMLKELTDLILEKSLKVADEPIFELASGRMSNLYIDCRKTTKNARGAYLIGNIIYDKIADLGVDAIGGLSMGADPVADAVAYTSVLKGKLINSFFVRKKDKEDGLKRVIEGDVKNGDRVVMGDDVAPPGQ